MSTNSFQVIDGTVRSVQEMFTGRSYAIEYYQREYSWARANIEELILDLTRSFNNDYVSKFSKFSASVDASRVTEKMKCYFFANLNSSQRKYIFDGVESKFPNTGYGLNATFVKSINSHWSAGGYGNYQYSTFSNFKKRIAFEPAIEYSFYKYADAVKKSIAFFYKIGLSSNDYIDSGYYDSPAHLPWSQSLSLRMAFTQKWGDIKFQFNRKRLLK